MKTAFALLLLCTVLAGHSAADDLQLTGKKHWLTLASSQDRDVAIGIARQVQNLPGGAEVVSSQSGYYAVIAGPYDETSINALKKHDKDGNFSQLPKDALLSQGKNYRGVVWKPDKPTLKFAGFSVEKAVQLLGDGVTVKVQGIKGSGESAFIDVAGQDKAGTSFHFEIGKGDKGDDAETVDSYSQFEYHQAALAKTVTLAGLPQVIITDFTGGAHCCTKTWIIHKSNDAKDWSLLQTETLDGGGYSFEDVDGDGAPEFISVDNSFFYAFDSYAGSFAPLHISKLEGDRIVDVSTLSAMKPRLRQDLAGMEYQAKVSPELLKSNGYLAAWVASKIRLGEGEEAWATFLKNYDAHADFGPQQCTTGQKIDDCPADNLKAIPIPQALAKFLKNGGYEPLPGDAKKRL